DEAIFDGLRKFIMDGGDISNYVIWKKKQVIVDVMMGLVPEAYCHSIIANATDRFIWCNLQFFLGPKNPRPDVYTVKVAENNSPLQYSMSSAHQFCVYPGGPKDSFDGLMEPMIPFSKSLML